MATLWCERVVGRMGFVGRNSLSGRNPNAWSLLRVQMLTHEARIVATRLILSTWAYHVYPTQYFPSATWMSISIKFF